MQEVVRETRRVRVGGEIGESFWTAGDRKGGEARVFAKPFTV